MYLREILIENSGAIRSLNLALEFRLDGLPKPIVLVGSNGSGKTNLLSIIADALFEAAANHYSDVLPTTGMGRAWFRIVGSRTITVGQGGSFCILKFDDQGVERFYTEKAGLVDLQSTINRVDLTLAGKIHWETEGTHKSFNVDDSQSKRLFQEGIYTYFPSNRSEIPYWLNTDAIPEQFDVRLKLDNRLERPIYVERALQNVKQWLISLLSDSRTEIYWNDSLPNPSWVTRGDPARAMQSSKVLDSCNELLNVLFSEKDLSLLWLGRKSSGKIAISKANDIYLPSLDAMSAGQSILFGVFGSLLYYGDTTQKGSGLNLSDIEGVCLIDEIDAHIHIETQANVLPKLIKLFPKIQFILTSHSPMFLLGLEKEIGSDGVQIIEMPTGTSVRAETYSEFGVALEALAASSAFTSRVLSQVRNASKPIIFVEGETDAPYIIRAIELFGKNELLSLCDIEWVGAKDTYGQGFNTGADAMKHTASVLKANPMLTVRKVMLLNDNDTKVCDFDSENLTIRKLPLNSNNKIVTAGIENLLPESKIDQTLYIEKTIHKPNGDTVVTKTLRKAQLCSLMCATGVLADFLAFESVIDEIKRFVYNN